MVSIVLFNGGHFRGISLIKGKYLLYDGMTIGGGDRTKWISPKSIFKNMGEYYVTQLWYRRASTEEEVEEPLDVETTTDANVDTIDTREKRGNFADSQHEDLSETYTTPKKKIKIESSSTVKAPKKKRPATKYPMGLSLTRVKAKGKKPKCKCCLAVIERGVLHSVNKTATYNDMGKRYTQDSHYHLECIETLSKREVLQLKKIVGRSDVIDEHTKKSVLEIYDSAKGNESD